MKRVAKEFFAAVSSSSPRVNQLMAEKVICIVTLYKTKHAFRGQLKSNVRKASYRLQRRWCCCRRGPLAIGHKRGFWNANLLLVNV